MAKMDHKAIEKECEKFLKSIGVPGFVVLGFKTDDEFTVTYSFNKVALKEIIPVLMSATSNLVMHALS